MSNSASSSETWPNLRQRIEDLVSSGRTDAIETLLTEHPDLRSDEQLLLDCIYAEFCFREERDQTPQPTEYLKRFPEYTGQLRVLFEVHEALDTPGLLDDAAGSVQRSLDDDPALFPTELGAPSTAPTDKTSSSRRIGPYKLLQLIGEGGMGAVYMADQMEPVRRRVALKLIKSGMDSRQVVARFEAERQALAMMDHQNIAKVLDAGITDDGTPYFAMELVQGMPITKYCDREKLSIADRLTLFVQVCRALQHAHQKGVIHRDIKPTNVLVTQRDGVPVAKVIDFGLAKAMQSELRLTDKTLFTEVGQVCGTLEYMSPEQAEMNELGLDTRTDVFSLGVLLYELLTGSTPLGHDRIRKEAFHRVLQLILTEEATRPSRRLSDSGDAITGISEQRRIEPRRLSGILKRELDWIALKALEKDRNRRYDGAGTLADDVQHYLDGDVVTARPPSTGYRLRKAVRKHKAAFVSGTVFVLLLLAGLLGTGTNWMRAENEAARAVDAEHRLAGSLKQMEESLYLSQINLAAAARGRGELLQLNRLLEHAGNAENRGFEWQYLSSGARPELVIYDEHECSVKAIAISPNGELAASGGSSGELRAWRVRDGRTIVRAEANSWELNSLAFSPDGRTLAVAGHLGRLALLDVESGHELRKFVGHGSQVFDVAFSPDGSTIASAGADMTVRLWDVQTAEQIHLLRGHRHMVFSVAFSPNGGLLASGGQEGGVRIWSRETGQQTQELTGVGAVVNEVAFSPDGNLVGAVHEVPQGGDQVEAAVAVWDFASGEQRMTVRQQKGSAHAIAFSPDSRFVASGADDGSIHLINVSTKETVIVHHGHIGRVWDLDFSDDGLLLASAGNDGTARIRSSFSDQRSTPLVSSYDAQDVAVTYLPSGERIAIGGERGAELRDLSGELIREFRDDGANGSWTSLSCIAVDRAEKRIAAFSGDQRVIAVWDLSTGELLYRLEGHNEWATDVVFSADGRQIFTGCLDRHVRIWDVNDGALLKTLGPARYPISAIAVNDDGTFLAAATSGHTRTQTSEDGMPHGQVLVWNLSNSEPPKVFRDEYGGVHDVAFSPNGTRIASGSADGVIDLWDVQTEQLVNSVPGHSGGVNALQFFSDGERLLSGGADRLVKIWDLRTGEQFLELNGHLQSVDSVSVSPDGQSLVTACMQTAVQILLWETDVTPRARERRMRMTYGPDWIRRQQSESAEEGNLYAAQWYAKILDEAGLIESDLPPETKLADPTTPPPPTPP